MGGIQHFHHIGEVWRTSTLRHHLGKVHHLADGADPFQQHDDDHLYFGYALDPPHDWDAPTPVVCDYCLINMCGLCEGEDVCDCWHGGKWPAENPWHALWMFGPGSVGYAGATAYQIACAENS
jgi:hypothetical protein